MGLVHQRNIGLILPSFCLQSFLRFRIGFQVSLQMLFQFMQLFLVIGNRFAQIGNGFFLLYNGIVEGLKL